MFFPQRGVATTKVAILISPQRHSAALPQPKQQSLFHHRGAEFAELGVFF